MSQTPFCGIPSCVFHTHLVEPWQNILEVIETPITTPATTIRIQRNTWARKNKLGSVIRVKICEYHDVADLVIFWIDNDAWLELEPVP